MASIVRHICKTVSELENTFLNDLLQRILPGQLALAFVGYPRIQHSKPSYSLEDVMNNSILWAVPKKRRSAEKVRNRRFGYPQYHWKPYVQMTNIATCRNCGYHYVRGALCGTCYGKVMKETQEMQKEIQKELQLSPVEEEVIVLYEGEKEEKDPEFWKGKRIIEMKKPRPVFFSANLLQPSTQPNAETSEVMEIKHQLEYK